MECSTWPENMSMVDRKRVVGELTEGREFANQLEKHLGDHGMVAANVFVTKILGAFGNALSILNSGEITGGDVCHSPMTNTTTQASSPFSDDGKCVDSGDKRKIPGVKDRRGGYKRRKSTNTWTEMTSKPTEDGYAWRKYGQKEILNAKHPRNYFRCTHKNDQGCKATKQVQQTDEGPQMYQTTYMGHHTCTNPLKPLKLILDPSSPSHPNSQNIFNFNSFPPIKLEFKNDQIPSAHQYQSSSSDHQYIYSPDLSAFESPAPTTMCLASSSGSDHGDVISSVYSCATSSGSLDLDFGRIDFNDMFLDEEVLLPSF